MKIYLLIFLFSNIYIILAGNPCNPNTGPSVLEINEEEILNQLNGQIQKISDFQAGSISMQTYSVDAINLCLDTQQYDLFLFYFSFCYINCSNFNINCKVANAQIFSVRISKSQHEEKCYLPRLKYEPDSLECFQKPCSCLIYENWFFKQYGKQKFHESLEKVKNECNTWCSTGIKPKDVWDKNEYYQKTKRGYEGIPTNVYRKPRYGRRNKGHGRSGKKYKNKHGF